VPQKGTRLFCDVGEEVAIGEHMDAAGRPKRVRYDAMIPPPSPRQRHNEVDTIRRLPRERAIDPLTYARDVDVIERLRNLGG
jgi:hypothetical protein